MTGTKLKGLVSLNADRHHPREGCSFSIPVTPQTYCEAVATVSWAHGPSGGVYPAQDAQNASTPLTVKASFCVSPAAQTRLTKLV